MTVLDTSAVVDFLLGIGVASEVEELMSTQGELAAPDLLVFEVLPVLRRKTHRQVISESRAAGAVDDLGDLAIELFPTLPLRQPAWTPRHNLTAADALFVGLAERLDAPLATKDTAKRPPSTPRLQPSPSPKTADAGPLRPPNPYIK